jgi:hypothetical protein
MKPACSRSTVSTSSRASYFVLPRYNKRRTLSSVGYRETRAEYPRDCPEKVANLPTTTQPPLLAVCRTTSCVILKIFSLSTRFSLCALTLPSKLPRNTHVPCRHRRRLFPRGYCRSRSVRTAIRRNIPSTFRTRPEFPHAVTDVNIYLLINIHQTNFGRRVDGTQRPKALLYVTPFQYPRRWQVTIRSNL